MCYFANLPNSWKNHRHLAPPNLLPLQQPPSLGVFFWFAVSNAKGNSKPGFCGEWRCQWRRHNMVFLEKIHQKGYSHHVCLFFFCRWWALPAEGTIVSRSCSILRDLLVFLCIKNLPQSKRNEQLLEEVWWKKPNELSVNWGDKFGWEGKPRGKWWGRHDKCHDKWHDDDLGNVFARCFCAFP